MTLGFFLGAGIATALAFALASRSGSFKYTGLFDMLLGLGALGAYLGHVLGAFRDKSGTIKPFGPLTPGILGTGALIVFLGSVLVIGTVLGIMTAIKGPPPH
jgi:hypothetical protein